MEADILIIIPFMALLISIAALPFINQKWWDKYYPAISVVLSMIVVAFYLLQGRISPVLKTAEDYVMFISFIGSIYVISGGILIKIKGIATPARNVALLAAGAVLSNFIGTIGASVILIRPFIRTNKVRFSAFHIVFFIFIVSNSGGLLTPIGNPPLLLGFLKGVPFFWIGQKSYLIWLMVVGTLLLAFYFFDLSNFRKQTLPEQKKEIKSHEKLIFTGWLNVILVALVIGSVFVTRPVFLREAIMIAAAIVSYKFTRKEIHLANEFSFNSIKEVAWLFLGIFITMSPALEALSRHSKEIALNSATQFYWYAGITSSILDNAPTYLAYLSAAMGLFGFDYNSTDDVLRFITAHQGQAIAISVSSVLFGAATYIGNAPNFMVKSIVEQQGIKTPGFLPYIYKYSLPILIPLFIMVWLIFIF